VRVDRCRYNGVRMYVCVFVCVCVFVYIYMEAAVAQWLRCCAENRKVAGSIPAGVIRIFH